MHTGRKLELSGLLCHLWYPVPGLPDHDGRGEGHATLPGRPEGRTHQLVNRVLLNKINMIATSGILCMASPTTTAVVRAMQRCPADLVLCCAHTETIHVKISCLFCICILHFTLKVISRN
jgi:hypothetical protein